MAEQIRCPSNHEQSETQAIRFSRIQAVKRIEDFRQMIGPYANTGIMNFDAHVRPAASTSDKNSTALGRIFDRVPDEIVQDAMQEDCVAQNDCAGRTDANRQAPLSRQVGILLM